MKYYVTVLKKYAAFTGSVRSVDLYKRRVQYATRHTIGQSRAPLHRALRTKCAHQASAETWLLNR